MVPCDKFPPWIWFSWDGFQIQYDPNQDKAVTEVTEYFLFFTSVPLHI